jgi:apolipoprotein N-acyltransferase
LTLFERLVSCVLPRTEVSSPFASGMPRRLALAVASGLLLVLSFPKFGHGIVVFFAPVPLFVALSGVKPFRGFLLAYVTGVVSSVGLLYWTALVVIQFGGLPVFVAGAAMVLLCLVIGLFTGVVGWSVAALGSRWGGRALFAAPVFWVAMEMVRIHAFWEFPWCLVGYALHDHPCLIQIAALGGVPLVSLFIVTVSACLAHGVVAEKRQERLVALSLGPGLVLLVLAFGVWRMGQPVAEAGRIRVGLVQASIRQEMKWEPSLAWDHMGRHLRLTDEAASQGARLIVWPESSVPFSFDTHLPTGDLMRQTTRRLGAHIVFGNDDRGRLPQGRDLYHVGAKMVGPDGALELRYHKMYLVPFGEYVPMQRLLTLGGRFSARLVENVAEFSPGTKPVVGRIDGHPLGVSICYEAIFPSLARAFVSNGAELLVNITNDGWYGRTSAPYQHLAMARFRAVETGRYLVRAANTGITAVVDPRGRIVAKTALFDETVLVADVPWTRGTTPYSSFGDVFGWASVGLGTVLSAMVLLGRRDSRASVERQVLR